MSNILSQIRQSEMGILARREYWRRRGQREMKKYSDYEFIKAHYEKLGRELDLVAPKRYTEKLQWLKLFYRNPLMPVCSDKYAVRDYLEEKGYGYLLNELIAVYDTVDSLDPSVLPEQFVLKASHGSGWNLIVKDKSKVNWFWWKKIMRSWLKQNLYWFGREWNYESQKPRIIVEKYLEDDSGELRDYKITCTNGKVRYIQIDENRATNHKRVYADCDGKPMFFGDSQNHKSLTNIAFGDAQKEMLRLAQQLSEPFPNVRVDFYEYGGKIFFGELTFFDGSGFFSFTPDEADFVIGSWLELPSPNYNLELYKKLHKAEDGL